MKIAFKDFQTYLHNKVRSHLVLIEKSEFYKVLSAPETSPELIIAILRSVLFEISSYGSYLTRASFAAIGRMPSGRTKIIENLTAHILEEVPHPQLALRDYIRLGGEAAAAQDSLLSPPALAMVSTCVWLSNYENPFCYVGWMYLLEALTPTIALRVHELIKTRNSFSYKLTFLDVHLVDDIEHESCLRKVIEEIADSYEEGAKMVRYGIECFAQVYPIPIFEYALGQARSFVNLRKT